MARLNEDFGLWAAALSAAAIATRSCPILMATAPAGRPGKLQQARGLAVYLLAVEGDLGATRAAATAGMSKQAVNKHLQRIEDRRESAELDAMLERARADFIRIGGRL